MESGRTHSPVADGDCLDCHNPHRSGQASLLVAVMPGVCLDCHDVEDDDFLAKHLGQSGTGLDCRKCHDPHVAEGDGLMAPLRHDPFDAGACDACHPEPAGTEGGN